MDVSREDDVAVTSRRLCYRQRHAGVSVARSLGPPRGASVDQRAVRDSRLRQKKVNERYIPARRASGARAGVGGKARYKDTACRRSFFVR